MRVALFAVVLVLVGVAGGSGRPLEAQAPAIYSGPVWQHGVLESVSDKEGWALVFCETTVEGCAERVLETGAYSRSAPIGSNNATGRRGRYDQNYARAIAKLGREGWELVAEIATGVPYCDTCRVLYFKRLAGTQ